jgi:high affinity Mn2+ porin
LTHGTIDFSRSSSPNRQFRLIATEKIELSASNPSSRISRTFQRAVFAITLALFALPLPAQEQGGSAQKPAQGQEKKDEPHAKAVPGLAKEARFDYQGEATFILQHLFKFHSPYEGEGSFRSRDETELSHSYTLFLGIRAVKNLEFYVNPELALGNGLSHGTGLAGYVNADLNGQPDLRPEPFITRYFVRWRIPMRHIGDHKGAEEESAVRIGRAPNVIAGPIPVHRLTVQLGKFGVTDVFDVNSYANDQRTQFFNAAFANNLAYDSPEEVRTYDLGAMVAWVNPAFAVRIGAFAMPTVPGGADLAYNLEHSHSEHIEVEFHPQLLKTPKPPFIVRFLGWRNTGNMGKYSSALAARDGSAAPSLDSVRRWGAVRSGFGINVEQALADGGDTGVFGRIGWADGAFESITDEADFALSFGGHLSGAHWGRKEDRVGLAYAQSGIGGAHKAYLAAGGQGLSVGDGQLRYGAESVVEVYYLYQLNKQVGFTFDYQFISNPGYNRDRGPVQVIGFRTHLSF